MNQFDGHQVKPNGYCQQCGDITDLLCGQCIFQMFEKYDMNNRQTMSEMLNGAADRLQALCEYTMEIERLLEITKKHNQELSKDLEFFAKTGQELKELAGEYLKPKTKKHGKKNKV